MPPRFPNAAYFVRKTDPTEQIVAHLRDQGGLWIHDVESIQGTGKTMLLSRLYAEVEASGVGRPAWVSLSKVRLPTARDERIESLERNFYGFCDVLAAFAKDLGFDDFLARVKDVREAVAEIPVRDVRIEQNVKFGVLSRIKGANFEWGAIKVEADEPPPEFFRRTIDVAQITLRDEFVRRLAELRGRDRPVLFADDYELAVAGGLSDWLIDLASQLDDAILIIARAESLAILGGLAGALVQLKLTNFDRDDIERFLRQRLEVAELPAGLAERVEKVTGGHPEAVYVAAQLAQRHGVDKPDVLALYDGVRGELKSRLGMLVGRLVDEIREEDVRRAVEVASVLRRFDAKTLNYMLERSEDDEPLIEALLQFAFTVEDEHAETAEVYYQLHEFVRVEQDERLMRAKPTLYETLHARAAVYYSEWLTKCELEDRAHAAYCRAYRYEAPEWQDMVSEWLYHLSRFDAASAALEVARVYLAAFWWWGCYIEFPFCERLLRAWEASDARAEVKEVIALLKSFASAYPPEAQPDAVQADWLQVEDAVVGLRRIERAAKPPRDEDAANRRRQLRAYLEVFLAHALRAQDVEDRAADDAYDKAAELFAQSPDGEDEWCLPWISYELGTLALERGDAAEAEAKAKDSLAGSLTDDLEDQDNEVVANAYQLLGDVAWNRGDTDAAFENYRLAALHAYAFQGFPNAADFYTVAFFGDIAGRVLGRVRELPDRLPPDRAAEVVAEMHAFWSEYWKRAGEPDLPAEPQELVGGRRFDELEAFLLPRAPTREDVGPGSDYVVRARTVADRIRRRLRSR